MTLSYTKALRLREVLNDHLSRRALELRTHAFTHDPVQVVHEFGRREDQELVAFLASCLAYGQRKVFIPIVRQVLGVMGPHPYEFVVSGDFRRADFDWFRYRFNDSSDLRCLFEGLHHILVHYGSLESAFVVARDATSGLREDLHLFVSLFRSQDLLRVYGPAGGTPGFRYLLPDPVKGGACKRLNMFLRWMVRRDSVDLGLWTGVSSSELVVPLDTHVQKMSLHLGLTSKKSSSWRTAEDITQSLSQLDPTDPLKYDFLLFSLGAWGEFV